jgi:hypothetical protein
MKKRSLLILGVVFLLTACSGAGETLADAPVATEPAGAETESLSTAPPQEILGKWVLDLEQSTGAGSSMLDPLEGEFYEVAGVEITSDYLILGDFGHTYSWIDDQRIRVDGVMLGFGAVAEGFFYVFTVQHEGDTLRFLLAEGTPFVVFGRAGSVAAAPAIDVAVSVEEIATTIPPAVPMQPVAPTPWTPCEGGYETHLFLGGYAYVNPVPFEPNLVRSEPNASSAQVGLVQPNELMEITDGPQCSGGWVWWQITSKKTGLSGWTSEGDGGSYWVLPCPVNGSECGSP